MGEQLQRQLGAEVELIAGGGGIFVVRADDREIFSKAKAGRFPEPAEIIAAIRGQ